MPGIAIKIDLNELYALANSKRWKSSEISKIKADLLGRYYKRELENASNRAFDRQTSPDGRPWLPRSPKYAKQLNRRRPGRKLLAITLHLKNSRQYQVSGDSAKYGSNVKYARIHQLGGKAGRQHKANIPARPYLGCDDYAKQKLLFITEKLLRRHFEQ